MKKVTQRRTSPARSENPDEKRRDFNLLDNLFKLLMVNQELPDGRQSFDVLQVIDLKSYWALFNKFKYTTLRFHKDVDMTGGLSYEIEKSLYKGD